MRLKVQAIKQELRPRMHQPIPDQGKWSKRVVQSYFNTNAKEKARINKQAAQKAVRFA